MTARTALITGITGQTGSYLAETLAERGWALHGLVRAGEPLSELPGGAEPVVGDLADVESLRTAIETTRPTAVVNLAAISSVAYSWNHPLETARVNGLSVAALLDAAHDQQQQTGVPVAVVQASSAEIFGAAASAPQNEATPIAPTNPYGASKAYGHHLVGVYRGLGLKASSAILYNHESPRRPETFVTRKITAGVARIAAGLQDELVLGDLSIRRDWGWAPDYAKAIAAILEGDAPDDYVVATGVSHSIADFVAAAFRAVGIEDWRPYVSIDHSLVRAGDSPEMRGDATRLRERYGWAPSVDFEGIVAAMVAHDRELLEN